MAAKFNKLPICHKCSKNTLPMERVEAGNLIFHGHCFVCEECGIKLSDTTHSSFEGSFYCMRDYYALLRKLKAPSETSGSNFIESVARDPINIPGRNKAQKPTCDVCQKRVFQVSGMSITIDGKIMHRACFVCRYCKEYLSEDNFHEHESAFYCPTHFFRVVQANGARKRRESEANTNNDENGNLYCMSVESKADQKKEEPLEANPENNGEPVIDYNDSQLDKLADKKYPDPDPILIDHANGSTEKMSEESDDIEGGDETKNEQQNNSPNDQHNNVLETDKISQNDATNAEGKMHPHQVQSDPLDPPKVKKEQQGPKVFSSIPKSVEEANKKSEIKDNPLLNTQDPSSGPQIAQIAHEKPIGQELSKETPKDHKAAEFRELEKDSLQEINQTPDKPNQEEDVVPGAPKQNGKDELKQDDPKQDELKKVLKQVEPKQDEIKQDEPKQVEHKQDEPKQDEPKQVELKQDEIKQDEPKQVELKQDEIKQDEPKQDEHKQDEPKQDEHKQDEPKQDEIKQDEIKQDEPKQVEHKQDEPKQDEPKQVELKQDEIKQDEPKQDEIKQDEHKQDEPKQDEPKQDERKQDAPKENGESNDKEKNDQTAHSDQGSSIGQKQLTIGENSVDKSDDSTTLNSARRNSKKSSSKRRTRADSNSKETKTRRRKSTKEVIEETSEEKAKRRKERRERRKREKKEKKEGGLSSSTSRRRSTSGSKKKTSTDKESKDKTELKVKPVAIESVSPRTRTKIDKSKSKKTGSGRFDKHEKSEKSEHSGVSVDEDGTSKKTKTRRGIMKRFPRKKTVSGSGVVAPAVTPKESDSTTGKLEKHSTLSSIVSGRWRKSKKDLSRMLHPSAGSIDTATTSESPPIEKPFKTVIPLSTSEDRLLTLSNGEASSEGSIVILEPSHNSEESIIEESSEAFSVSLEDKSLPVICPPIDISPPEYFSTVAPIEPCCDLEELDPCINDLDIPEGPGREIREYGKLEPAPRVEIDFDAVVPIPKSEFERIKLEGILRAKVVRIGLIGMQRRLFTLIGTFQCSYPHQLEVVAAARLSQQAQEIAKENFGDVKIVEDADTLLAMDDIQWVFVSVPANQTSSVIQQVLQSGKHVFCEKPITTNLSECIAIQESLQNLSNQYFLSGFVWRHVPFYQEVYNIIKQGSIGDVLSVEANHLLDPGSAGLLMSDWTRFSHLSHSLVMESFVYDIDLLSWLLDSLPTQVVSFSGRNMFIPDRKPDSDEEMAAYKQWPVMPMNESETTCPFSTDKTIDDNQLIMMNFKNDARVTLHLNAHSSFPQRRLLICGTTGTLEGDLYTGQIRYKFVGDNTVGRIQVTPGDAHGGSDNRLIEGFLLCALHGDSEFCYSGVDIFPSVAAVLAISESAETNQVINMEEYWKKLNLKKEQKINLSKINSEKDQAVNISKKTNLNVT